MSKPECKSCGFRGVCRDSAASWVFFSIGVVATVAMRVIEPLRSVSPLYGKISWYVGVAGFLLFFIYKYLGSRRRSEVIRLSGLKEKLESNSGLTAVDYGVLAELVCSEDNWKERVNFFVIFALSAAALAVALWMDSAG